MQQQDIPLQIEPEAHQPLSKLQPSGIEPLQLMNPHAPLLESPTPTESTTYVAALVANT